MGAMLDIDWVTASIFLFFPGIAVFNDGKGTGNNGSAADTLRPFAAISR